uniref:Transcription initiation factor IIE, alpha finger n=1 Tax=Myoviridae sp. ctPuP5 TaxID=2823543 RepID=A0A8S5L9V7_9CAUD|nr:MAG TPA: transcription initiation factor IIE, alpha finger [Myoviridae sp. ctPuP5]
MIKKIVKHHSKHITDEIYTDFYKCPYCKSGSIQEHYKFCPMCGKEIEFQSSREYERELLNRIISRIKYRLYNYFTLIKQENGTFKLLDKHGDDGKELSKLAKTVIAHILLSFTEKKVYKPPFTHPILYNEVNFKFDSVAKVKANLIFKEFIAEYKEKLK